ADENGRGVRRDGQGEVCDGTRSVGEYFANGAELNHGTPHHNAVARSCWAGTPQVLYRRTDADDGPVGAGVNPYRDFSNAHPLIDVLRVDANQASLFYRLAIRPIF